MHRVCHEYGICFESVPPLSTFASYAPATKFRRFKNYIEVWRQNYQRESIFIITSKKIFAFVRQMHQLSGTIRFSEPINLKDTLLGGQSFRWRPHPSNGTFLGIANGVLYELSAVDELLNFTVIACTNSALDTYSTSHDKLTVSFEDSIKKYFRHNISSSVLSREFGVKMENLVVIHPQLSGVRLLDQERFETFITFIRSANSNISSIAYSVNSFAQQFGIQLLPLIIENDKIRLISQNENIPFENWTTAKSLDLTCSFPSLEVYLTSFKESHVEEYRKMKFGYRAEHLQKSINYLLTNDKLRKTFEDCDSEDVEQFLNDNFAGVGPKVAACIALMGFGQLNCVPVDVHILRIVMHLYGTESTLSHLKDKKSLRPIDHQTIKQWFIKHFGPRCGWAQLWLFVADLYRSQKDRGNERPSNKKKEKTATVKVTVVKKKIEEKIGNERPKRARRGV